MQAVFSARPKRYHFHFAVKTAKLIVVEISSIIIKILLCKKTALNVMVLHFKTICKSKVLSQPVICFFHQIFHV